MFGSVQPSPATLVRAAFSFSNLPQHKKRTDTFWYRFFLELLARFELATVLPRKLFRGSPYDLVIEMDEVAS